MNAPIHPVPTFRLEDYPFRIDDNVRFADLDPQHHVNNAVYASYFETGRVTLIRNPAYGLMPEGFSWVLGHLAIDFRAEVRWPGTIEMGLGVSRIGKTSVSYRQVVFSEGKCAASAEAVTVLLDADTRKPAPLPAEIIEKFQPWMLRGA
ncbi:acyl-CoA thioesterase [Bradyrhizobium sp. SYSU BS000235]|uniref:acyl-CoA thioesterase n=1 Tax=Bradyrhizobium sp. SYSU BS000235 TaxID=3411332 RepID=UPI003C722BF0